MFLLNVFIIEYLLGEIAYEVFDDWFYVFNGWYDLKIVYFIIVGTIDIIVAAILMDRQKTKYHLYAALASLSFFANVSGGYLYIADASNTLYLSVMHTILALKLMLVINGMIPNVRERTGRIANTIFYSLGYSRSCLYIWQVVKDNTKQKG